MIITTESYLWELNYAISSVLPLMKRDAENTLLHFKFKMPKVEPILHVYVQVTEEMIGLGEDWLRNYINKMAVDAIKRAIKKQSALPV